ncbi:MAG: TRAP transporter small permease, partial [Bacillota bacterium]
MKFLNRFGKYYNFFEEHLMVIFLGIMTAVVFVQVVLRFVFNGSLTWSEEGARFFFMWIIWMSMSVGLRDKSHIRMTVIYDKLSPRGQLYLHLLNNLIILVFSLFIAVLG